MPDSKIWRANGKLLLTGEYLVLEGAKALAIPVNKGQTLRVQAEKTQDFPVLVWDACQLNKPWFRAKFRLPELSVIRTSEEALATDLQKLLKACQAMTPGFLDSSHSFRAETNLEFDSDFGFGSSSTLVSNLAFWADIDPFRLQRTVLGGSGYDIACARNDKPIIYQLVHEEPVVKKTTLCFPFSQNLYFVYLGRKQSTPDSIRVFRQKAAFSSREKERISGISEALAKVQELEEFENLLEEHEKIISSVLGLIPVKQKLFPDHPGTVKSLGAWGGDFTLMTALTPHTELKKYLSKKGFDTFYSWDELILK